MLKIGQSLDKFGFHEKADLDYPDVELIAVPRALKLKDISELAGVPEKQLQQINPHLIRGMTPPGKGKYEVWIPQERLPFVRAAQNQLAQRVIKNLKPRRFIADIRATRIHRVRRGQTLGHIARRYRSSIAYLRRINGIKGSRIYIGQRLRIRAAKYTRSHSYHIVRKGQTLGLIARRSRMSLKQLKKLNGLHSNRILVGQKIRIKKRPRLIAKTSGPIKYRVRRGDNLSSIAKKFRTTVRKLKSINRLKASRIYPGKYLVVRR